MLAQKSSSNERARCLIMGSDLVSKSSALFKPVVMYSQQKRKEALAVCQWTSTIPRGSLHLDNRKYAPTIVQQHAHGRNPTTES